VHRRTPDHRPRTTQAGTGQGDPITKQTNDRSADSSRYEIRLAGRLDARWAAWFDEMTLTHADDGSTVLTGPAVDQAALHGLLRKVRDLGLPLLAVTQLDPIQPHTSTSPSPQLRKEAT
jgi:hypothetical protein